MKPKVKKKEERRRKRAQVCTETTILLRVTQWYRGEKLEERGDHLHFVSHLSSFSTIHFPHLQHSKGRQWKVMVGTE